MREKIDQLFELIDITATAKQFIGQVLRQFAKLGESDPEFFAAIFAGLNAKVAARIGELTDNMAEVYEKYYTEEDIDAMLAWHNSPTGKKIHALAPNIQAETSAFGEKWGHDLVEEFAAEMEKIQTDINK